MNIFEAVIKNFELLGLSWDESSKKYVYTKRYYITAFVSIPCIVGEICFLTYDAKTFFDYTLGCIIISTAVMTSAISVILKMNVNILNDWIETWENIIEESKWHYFCGCFFVKAN